MTEPTLILGAPEWRSVAAGLAGLGLALIAWSYARSRAKPSVRIACAILKALAFASLAAVLLEPLLSGARPRRGDPGGVRRCADHQQAGAGAHRQRGVGDGEQLGVGAPVGQTRGDGGRDGVRVPEHRLVHDRRVHRGTPSSLTFDRAPADRPR